MIRIVSDRPVCSFTADWLRPVFDPYLSFETWDPDQRYPRGTLAYMNLSDWSDPAAATAQAQQWRDRGFGVVIDNLWEADPGPEPHTHRIHCDQWFWFNESLWYSYLGLDQYRPQRRPQYTALMPVNRTRPHRTEFLQLLGATKDRMLWSAVELLGRQLPGDRDMRDWNTQRYMNPEWYDQAFCSVVLESAVRPLSRYTRRFVTEKTMKPLAFGHPAIVYGNWGTLELLRSWGFETWASWWDESYDLVPDHTQRRDLVLDLVRSIHIRDHSPSELALLEHNRSHFFRRDLVIEGLIRTVVAPLEAFSRGL